MDVVAGGPDDYMEVCHLVLRGTNRQIGEELALLARDRHRVVPATGGDPLVTRARRRWYQREWPAHYERMRGVADVHGVDVQDDGFELGLLPWLGSPPLRSDPQPWPGCSVAWLPPSVTSSGHPTLSRNYDFPTGTLTEILGGEAQPGELPMTSRPYVVETRPTNGGPACLFLCAYELLGGCIDGVNEEGLVVALLADDESGATDPTLAPAVGLNEIQLLRFLLETCADTVEAREALLTAKQHYMFLPCHFLVADATGDSFVWERTANREHLVEGRCEVQVVTNHLLHGRPSVGDLPPEDGPSATYARARRLTEALAARTGPLSSDDVKAAHACVHREQPGAAVRTLWHGVYDAADRSLEISFYLGEGPDGAVRRSEYLTFGL